METKKSIVSDIFKNISFSEKDLIFMTNTFTKITLKKGDIVLAPGTYANHQYYVYSGCLRSFFINASGKDHTTQFAIKDWWISDYTSFFTDEKAVMSIECIQDAIIYKFSRKDMNILCEKIPKVETFFRNKMEKAFANFQKRILEYLSQSAKERYLKFVINLYIKL